MSIFLILTSEILQILSAGINNLTKKLTITKTNTTKIRENEIFTLYLRGSTDMSKLTLSFIRFKISCPDSIVPVLNCLKLLTLITQSLRKFI